MSRIVKFIYTLRRKPYVEIVSKVYDKQNGWKFELDWNKYFIAQLASEGIDGDTDEEMIYTWLSMLMRKAQIEELEEELMEVAKNMSNLENIEG